MDLSASLNDILASSTSLTADSVLSTLQPHDIELVDAIVNRAPNATTFLTVYKAYNEVLEEKGLNAANDVVYYKFLLKLGVVKGSTWAEKWRSAKSQHGFDQSDRSWPVTVDSTMTSSAKSSMRLADSRKHSLDTIGNTGPTRSFNQDKQSRKVTNLPLTSRARLRNGHSKSSAPALPQLPAEKTISSRTGAHSKNVHLETGVDRRRDRILVNRQSLPESVILQQSDTWENLRYAQAERIADEFLSQRLLSQYFKLWRTGAEWILVIQTTSQQVTDSYHQMKVAWYLSQWVQKIKSIQKRNAFAEQFSTHTALVSSWLVWRRVLLATRRAKYQRELRARYGIMCEMREDTLRFISWTKWRHAFLARIIQEKDLHRLCKSNFQHWKRRLSFVAALNTNGDIFLQQASRCAMLNTLSEWRVQLHYRNLQRKGSTMLSIRLCQRIFTQWKKTTSTSRAATCFRRQTVTRRSLAIWKSAETRKCRMLDCADEYRGRHDSNLLHGLLRTWVARERLFLLQRVQNVRLSRFALKQWQHSMARTESLRELAKAKAIISSRAVVRKAFHVWSTNIRRKWEVRRACEQRHTTRLSECALVMWRYKLRSRVRALQQAKVARRFLVERLAWATWRRVFRVRSLALLGVACERATLTSFLKAWKQAFALKLVEKDVRDRRDRACVRRHLQLWTTYVVETKWRELLTVEQRATMLKRSAFSKWKMSVEHLKENKNLLDSFCIVQTEEHLRRLFLGWLSSARKTKRRRVRLESHQTRTNDMTMLAAWEQWKGRYTEERFRPLEREMSVRINANTVFKAFMAWQSRAPIVPAIRMRTVTLKRRAWVQWRQLMPRAMQVRDANRHAMQGTLRLFFDRWARSAREKANFRSIARERYLRLSRGQPNKTTSKQPRAKQIPLPSSLVKSNAKGNGGVTSTHSDLDAPLKKAGRHFQRSSLTDSRPQSFRGSEEFEAEDAWGRLRRAFTHDRLPLN